MTEDQETLSPICLGCGKRAKTEPLDTGHALWASLEEGWLVGLRRSQSGGGTLVFACSEDCARESDDLSARARSSAPQLASLLA